MPDPSKPGPLPSLLPFLLAAAVLIAIFVALLLYPAPHGPAGTAGCATPGHTGCARQG